MTEQPREFPEPVENDDPALDDTTDGDADAGEPVKGAEPGNEYQDATGDETSRP